jgi:hypothetical protein
MAVPLFSEAVGLRADISLPLETALGRGQTTEVGAYANQRLNLAKLGRPMEEMPWFRTGPGKTGRPGLSGGPAKRSHGGIVNPPCNRKGKCGNPAPTAGARGFYPNRRFWPRCGVVVGAGQSQRTGQARWRLLLLYRRAHPGALSIG